jgi:hypothetical protein
MPSAVAGAVGGDGVGAAPELETCWLRRGSVRDAERDRMTRERGGSHLLVKIELLGCAFALL